MNDDVLEIDEELELSRRGLLVKGGLVAAGLSVLGGPTSAAFGASDATTKVAVVTHGDTGSFWSVFKKGVDQAAKDLKGRGISVSQVYANNNVQKQASSINAAIAGGAKVTGTWGPAASALKAPLTKASKRGVAGITGTPALGALKTP